MGPAGPLSLLLWTHTVLAAIVSSEDSPEITNGGVVRQKRQYTTNDTIEDILRRITDVEETVTRTESAVENISEYLAALGFHLNPNETDLQRSQNPCEKYSQDDPEGQNEMPWTLWGNSKCLKLLDGLSTFPDATARCRRQYAKGQDISYPAVVSFDPSNNAASLVGLLRERLDGSSLWVGRRSPSVVLNCTEMRVKNSSEEHVTRKDVDCGVLNRVVCEKPLPLSFVELAEGQLETKQRLETEVADLRKRLEEVEGTLLRLVEKLDQKMSTTQTLEYATEVSTTSAVNAPAWELGGQTAFNVSQAMGVWRWIEVFGKDARFTAHPCEEWVLNLRGSAVERAYRRAWLGRNIEEKVDLTLDTQSPHHWTHEGWWAWTWVTTDYANWAVLMVCRNKELSSCKYLHVLSRERTLPPATLEMLRNVAEQRGFLRTRGTVVDQSSC